MAGLRVGRRGAPPVRAFRRLWQGARSTRPARAGLSLLLQPRRDRARIGGLGQRAARPAPGAGWTALSRHLPTSVGGGATRARRGGPRALPAPRFGARGRGSRSLSLLRRIARPHRGPAAADG